MTLTFSNLMLISTILDRKCTSIPFRSKFRYFLFLSSIYRNGLYILYAHSHLFLSQPEESKRTNKSIEDDRKFALDAAIVRIMKARKEMTYEHLKAATIDSMKSHFVPQVDIIKKRIDVLVEAEYLERSEDDRNRYKYIA